MIFSDLIFVFAFLPIYLTLSFCCREPWSKNAVSVAASLVFIAWGRGQAPVYYLLIMAPVFIIYILGFIPRRKNMLFFEILGDASAVLTAVYLAAVSGTGASLGSALISVGFVLFALRCILYNKDVASGMQPEKDFFVLAAYFISLENMLIAPLADYRTSEKALKSRRPALSKMSTGLVEFIKGFAMTAIIGLSFDRVRLAAVEYDAFPWANAVLLVLVTVGEVYAVTAGVLEMSCGLGLMSGLSPRLRTPAFVPRFRVSDHVCEMWEGFAEFVRRCFFERSAVGVIISLVLLSLVSAGIMLGLGVAAGAFVGIIILAAVLECIPGRRSRVSDAVFSAVILIFAFSVPIFDTAGGIAAFFSSFSTDYGYDVTFALHDELMRSLPWLIIGVFAVSPLRRALTAEIRLKMAESEKFYGAARAVETVICVILLIISCASAAV